MCIASVCDNDAYFGQRVSEFMLLLSAREFYLLSCFSSPYLQLIVGKFDDVIQTCPPTTLACLQLERKIGYISTCVKCVSSKTN